jgi:hypothetical protein
MEAPPTALVVVVVTPFPLVGSTLSSAEGEETKEDDAGLLQRRH